MLKQKIKKALNTLGLYGLVEKINFNRTKILHQKSNTKFIKENPDVVLPPDFYLYETFGLDYNNYYFGGKKTAEWILDTIKKNRNINNTTILDWGCGPARILRHIPNLTSNATVFGSDYNSDYVNWCSKNINNVTVKANALAPPLSFNDNFFDIVYVISIFTHLSDEMHHKWIQELYRVAKKDAVILITTHGNAHKFKLSPQEKKDFENGKLIEHSYKIEGNRLFASYQPKSYFQNLAENTGFTVLEHQERGVQNGKPTQDVWLLRK